MSKVTLTFVFGSGHTFYGCLYPVAMFLGPVDCFSLLHIDYSRDGYIRYNGYLGMYPVSIRIGGSSHGQGGKARYVLYCRYAGGYPAGTLRWDRGWGGIRFQVGYALFFAGSGDLFYGRLQEVRQTTTFHYPLSY